MSYNEKSLYSVLKGTTIPSMERDTVVITHLVCTLSGNFPNGQYAGSAELHPKQS